MVHPTLAKGDEGDETRPVPRAPDLARVEHMTAEEGLVLFRGVKSGQQGQPFIERGAVRQRGGGHIGLFQARKGEAHRQSIDRA